DCSHVEITIEPQRGPPPRQRPGRTTQAPGGGRPESPGAPSPQPPGQEDHRRLLRPPRLPPAPADRPRRGLQRPGPPARGDQRPLREPRQAEDRMKPPGQDAPEASSPGRGLTPTQNRILDAAEAILSDPQASDLDRAFIARQVVQVTLPHADPGDVPV